MSKRKVLEINKQNFPYDLVVAYWEDIVGSCEWSDISDIKKAKTAVCCSFGWLVEQNEKTGVMQKIAGFLQNQNPYNDIMEDNSVVDPQTGRSINKNLLEMLNNRPDLRQRFNETGTIYSE